MRKRWIFAAAVAVVAVVIGIVFGYLAGVAVVLAVITVGVFFAWGGGWDHAYQSGRSLAAEQERGEAQRADRRAGRRSK